MKRILLLSSIIIALLSFTSCEGETGPMGPPGIDGGANEWYTYYIDINENDWILEGKPGEANSFYFYDKDIPKLSDFIFKDGNVSAFIVFDDVIKSSLPYVLHIDENGKRSTVTINFEYLKGSVRFIISYSDMNTHKRPGNETFYLVLESPE